MRATSFFAYFVLFFQKRTPKICVCQKNVVPLHAFYGEMGIPQLQKRFLYRIKYKKYTKWQVYKKLEIMAPS